MSHPRCESSLYPEYPQCIWHLLISQLVANSVGRSTVRVTQFVYVQITFFYLILLPKRRSSDAGNSDILLLC